MLAWLPFCVAGEAIALSIVIGLFATLAGSMLLAISIIETDVSYKRFNSILETGAICFFIVGFLFAMFCVSTTSTHILKVSVKLQLKSLTLPTGRC